MDHNSAGGETITMVSCLPTGEMEFRVFAPDAGRVEILGSFTNWDHAPEPLRPSSDGWWTFCAELKPGDHQFAYRIDGWIMQADYAAHGVSRNSKGQWISGLYVPAGPVADDALAA